MNYIDSNLKVFVGTRPIRPDGTDKVTGRAVFARRYARFGHVVGQNPPLAARPCPDRIDRHLESRGLAGACGPSSRRRIFRTSPPRKPSLARGR